MWWWWWTGCRVVKLCVASCRAGPRSRRFVADVPMETFPTYPRTPCSPQTRLLCPHTHKHTPHTNHTPRTLIHTTHHPTTRNTLHTPQQHDNNTTTHTTHTLKLKLHAGTPLHMAPTTNPPPNNTNPTPARQPRDENRCDNPKTHNLLRSNQSAPTGSPATSNSHR